MHKISWYTRILCGFLDYLEAVRESITESLIRCPASNVSCQYHTSFHALKGTMQRGSPVRADRGWRPHTDTLSKK
jgi:hypothetical protein